jgi:type IV secretory pathway VirB6-like protein
MKKFLSAVFFSVFPAVVFGQGTNYIYKGGGIVGLFSWVGVMLNLLLPLIISLTVVWFIFTVFRYTIIEADQEKEFAKKQIIWGIIGIFAMISVWGLVNILRSTFNLNTSRLNAPIININ